MLKLIEGIKRIRLWRPPTMTKVTQPVGRGTSHALKYTWSATKVSLMIIGAMTVVVCLVGGILAGTFICQLTNSTEIEGEMHEVDVSEEYAESFDEKWDDFTNDEEEGAKTLCVTEEEVSSKLIEMVSEYKDEIPVPMDIKDVSVNFEPGSTSAAIGSDPNGIRARVAITAKAFGLTFHLAGKGIINIVERDGKQFLCYDIERIDFGHAPGQLREMVEDAIEEQSDEFEIPDDVNIGNLELIETNDLLEAGLTKYDLRVEATLL